jgi:hypothetical protein
MIGGSSTRASQSGWSVPMNKPAQLMLISRLRHQPQAPRLLGQQLSRVSAQPNGGADDGGDLMVVDLGVRTRRASRS